MASPDLLKEQSVVIVARALDARQSHELTPHRTLIDSVDVDVTPVQVLAIPRTEVSAFAQRVETRHDLAKIVTRGEDELDSGLRVETAVTFRSNASDSASTGKQVHMHVRLQLDADPVPVAVAEAHAPVRRATVTVIPMSNHWLSPCSSSQRNAR